ncbi:MAG: hypothetical protein ABIJ45_13530 [Candidatus Zixiibacteriota bacterium]
MGKKKDKKEKIIDSVFILVSLFLGLRLISSFFPEIRLWGLNQASYIDDMFFIYPLLFVIAVAVYIGATKYHWLTDSGQKMNFSIPHKTIYPYSIIILAGLSFYFFSANSHFLGDGYAAISGLMNPETITKAREYGEIIFHILFLKTFGTYTGQFARFTFQIISYSSGLLFLIALFFYSRKLTNSRFSYYSFVILNILAAGTILYFGYVEYYSIVSMTLYVTVLSGLTAVRNQNKSIVPIFAFILSVFLHSISLLYLPGIVIYIALTFGSERFRLFLLHHIKTILIAMCATYVLFYTIIKLWGPLFWQLAFLSPFGDQFTTDNYFIFSPQHLLDFANLLVFLTPITIIIGILYFWLPKNKPANIGRADDIFLLMVTLCGLLAAFTLEPKLSMGRDWDLMSTMLIGVGITGIYFWCNKFNQLPGFRPATFLLIILSLSIFLPWAALHNSIRAMYKYNLTLMELDPKHGKAGFYTMIEFHKRQGNNSEVNRLQKYCESNFPEVYIVGDAETLIEQNQLDQAEILLHKAIGHNPGWFVPYRTLAKCRIKQGDRKQALENLKLADGLNPYNPDITRLIDSLQSEN